MAETITSEVLQVSLRGHATTLLLRLPQTGPGLTADMVKRFADYFSNTPLLTEDGQPFNGTVNYAQIVKRSVTDALQLQEEVAN